METKQYIYNEIMKEYTEKEFLEIQNELAKKLDLTNKIGIEKIEKVAGVDLAYFEKNGVDMAVCSIVVTDFKTGKVLEKINKFGEIDVPYIPGFLSFRELPLFEKTFIELKENPDIYIFDGNGYLHPRHMGLASQASFLLDKPTIGVAKTYYKIENTDYVMPDTKKGSYENIIIDGEIYGRVLRTHDDVKPVFISVGNYIDIDMATEVVMKLVNKESHIPIPTRLADIETRVARTDYLK